MRDQTCGVERWAIVADGYLGTQAPEVTHRCDRQRGHDGAHSYEGHEFEHRPAPTMGHQEDMTPCWGTVANDRGVLRCAEHGRAVWGAGPFSA